MVVSSKATNNYDKKLNVVIKMIIIIQYNKNIM